jgi:hypothetical protein
MNSFVTNGNFTKVVSIVVIALITLGSGIILSLILLKGLGVNTAVLVALSGALGSGLTFFTKATGVQDGANIVQGAVNSVTAPMVTAINASPGVSPTATEAVVSASPSVSTPPVG